MTNLLAAQSPTLHASVADGADRSGLLTGLTVTAAVGSALVGGVFFAFSTFVMPAMKRLPDAEGIRAMQSINVTAVTPLFMLALFGTAVLAIVVAVQTLRAPHHAGTALTVAAAVAYVVLVTGVTVVGNVPMNDALARLDPSAASSVADWHRYLTSWTLLNHLRTLGGLAAGALFTVALLRGRP